jgi:hypothetical protein
VKGLAFVLALGALLLSCLEFWERTRKDLERARLLRDEIAAQLEAGIARAREDGAPPSEAELTASRSAARALAQEAAALQAEWFGDAARAADWLLPRAARPSDDPVAAERDRIAQALLALPAELKAWPGITFGRLGLVVPSLTDSFPTEPAVLADQAERAAAVRHLLASLRSVGPVRIGDASLQRDPAGRLLLRLEVDAAPSDAVALHGKFLASSDDAPPRRLERSELARLAPDAWENATKTLPAPPVRLKITASFERPGPVAAATRR